MKNILTEIPLLETKNYQLKKLLEKFGFHQEGILRQTDFEGNDIMIPLCIQC